MALQRFLVAPVEHGLQQNLRPWLLLNDGFQTLQNVRCWRGRVVNRLGAETINQAAALGLQQQFARLRIKVGTTNGAGALAGTAPGTITSVPFPWFIGQMFSAGVEMYNVNIANGVQLSTGAGALTYNTANGHYSLVGGPLMTDVYFYPSLPVMALPTYNVNSISDEQIFAFDTQFAYNLITATNGWQRAGVTATAPGAGIWSGTDQNFFSTDNWISTVGTDFLLFVVNNNPADGIQYWDGNTWAAPLFPRYDATVQDVIQTARFLLVFKNRLLLFNTTEFVQAAPGPAAFNFVDRIRWCLPDNATGATGWRQDINFGASTFVDLGTREAIIGAALIKDRVIIYTEHSTWELVYTGNESDPFFPQRIDNQLGVESFNSIVNFDQQSLGFGSTGLHACNITNVDRIDTQIPDTAFTISNQNGGPQRVFGIRQYYTEEVYWSYPSIDLQGVNNPTYPNQLIVYNYRNNSFSQSDDSITAFGYWQQNSAITWQDLTLEWQQWNDQWDDADEQALYRAIMCGNQEGFTFLQTENIGNAIAYTITDITQGAGNLLTLVINNHNMTTNTFIYIQNAIGAGGGNNIGTLVNGFIFPVDMVIDANTIQISVTAPLVGTYAGAGTATLVSQIVINTKQYNFFNEVGKQLHVPRIDFLVAQTVNGEITFDFSTSSSTLALQATSNLGGTAWGNNALQTSAQTALETTQTQLWRSIYPIAEGELIQVRLYYNAIEMLNPNIVFSAFELHAMLFYAEKTQDFQQGW